MVPHVVRIETRKESAMWHTRITEQFGLEFPFVSAGMGFVAMPPLVAAVCEAGGMGTLGASPQLPETVRALIRDIRARTARPFGVNFVTPFATADHIDVCLEEQVPVVSFHWDEPPAGHIRRLRAGGVRVWLQVGSVEMACQAAELGVDALIVQGSEAGGHVRGSASTLVLVPAIADAVAPLPVLAAGGIADGRGVAAALALGAEAVWVGTRLLASQEANVRHDYKQRVVAAGVADTTVTTLFGPEWPDAPARVLRNRVVREWAGREQEALRTAAGAPSIGQTDFLGQDYAMPKFSALLPTPTTTGDLDEMMLAAGESAGLIREIRPAGELARKMMDDAWQIIHGRLPAIARAARADSGRETATPPFTPRSAGTAPA
jgi:NAD(P)H-dependent flavin oxidoreductase YrpB (nitropropane dioxygenase family)